MRTLSLQAVLALVGALHVFAPPVQAQFFAPGASAVQGGVSAVPGIGVQVVYLQPRTVFTFEAAFYADVQAPFSDTGDRRFQAAGAVGGSLRLLQITRMVAGTGPGGELDVGLRAGPGLGFETEETLADKNRRFRLLFDPFLRYVRPIGGVRLFGELGLARPRLRAGVQFSL